MSFPNASQFSFSTIHFRVYIYDTYFKLRSIFKIRWMIYRIVCRVWNLICRFAKLTHWLNGFAFNANKRIWQMSIFDVWTRVSQIHLNFCFSKTHFSFYIYDNISSFDLKSERWLNAINKRIKTVLYRRFLGMFICFGLSDRLKIAGGAWAWRETPMLAIRKFWRSQPGLARTLCS